MNYELLFIKSLILTIVIETIVMIVFFRYIIKLKNTGISKLLITGFITSFATLPYLWFLFPVYIHNKIIYMVFAESFAVLIETIIIASILKTKITVSFLCSLTCNMISFISGLIINL